MSIKIQDVVANTVLPLSQFSTMGTRDNPWDALFTNTIHAQHIIPNTTNQYDLGTSSLKWKNVYGDNFYGNANSANKVNKKLQFYALDSTQTEGIAHLTNKDFDGSTKQDISLRTLAGSNTELQKYINYTGGSAIKPVYFDKGALMVGNLYAGGTKVTLNGADKEASAVSFYAPISAGIKDQYLKFGNSGVPVWATTTVSSSWKNGQAAGPKLTITVNGVSSEETTIPTATVDNSGVITTDVQTLSGAKTLTNTLTLSNGKLQASTTFYLSSADKTSIIFQNGETEAARFNPSGCLNLGGHSSTSSTFKLNIKGNALINTSNAGWYLTDGTGYNYPGIYDNTTNLWIGAVKAASKHHTGGTMISTGYNKDTGTGNNSIYVAIPNVNNDGATVRQVLHEGYIAGKSGINYGTEAQRDALTATATTGQMFFVLI